MNFKKIFLILVNLALFMCLFSGCKNTSNSQTETTQSQITEKATAKKEGITEYEAKSKITTSDVKNAIVNGVRSSYEPHLDKAYTPDIASISCIDETSNYYEFLVKGTVAGYYGEYNENFSSGTFDVTLYVYKESGNVSSGSVTYNPD